MLSQRMFQRMLLVGWWCSICSKKWKVNHPPNHNVYRWYVYPSQSWRLFMALLPTIELIISVYCISRLNKVHGRLLKFHGSKPPTRYSRINPHDIPIFHWFSHGFPMDLWWFPRSLRIQLGWSPITPTTSFSSSCAWSALASMAARASQVSSKGSAWPDAVRKRGRLNQGKMKISPTQIWTIGIYVGFRSNSENWWSRWNSRRFMIAKLVNILQLDRKKRQWFHCGLEWDDLPNDVFGKI